MMPALNSNVSRSTSNSISIESLSSSTPDLVMQSSGTSSASTPSNNHLDVTNLLPEFRDFGLVEVLLSSSEQSSEPTWFDAYIIDFALANNKSKTPKALQPNRSSHAPVVMAIVVIAVDDQQPLKTLSEMKNVQKVPLEQLRLKPITPGEFTENDMVEVRTVLDNKMITWKLARVKKIKRDFVALELKSTEEIDEEANKSCGQLDVVSRDSVRVPSRMSSFSSLAHPFYRLPFAFSETLLKKFHNNTDWLCDMELHHEFKARLNHICVYFDKTTRSLVCLGIAPSIEEKAFFESKALESTQILLSFHLNRLVDIFAINLGLSHRLEVANEPNDFVLKLKIDERLVGLAIGKSGQNIQKARNITGVKMVEYDEYEKAFIIKADSLELCKKAASNLNFKETALHYDYQLYREFFEDRSIIQEVTSVSKVYAIYVDPVLDDVSPARYRIKLIGTVESIEAFQFVLDYQIEEWKEIQQLKAKLADLYNQIFKNPADVRQQMGRRGNIRRSFVASSALPKNFAEAVKAGMP